MPINISAPELRELKPRIIVLGVGGAGGNAINNMINQGIVGVEYVAANTDAQDLKNHCRGFKGQRGGRQGSWAEQPGRQRLLAPW